jgi:hypothetical protein
MGNASDETAPPVIKLHPFYEACKVALVSKTGSDNIIMNKASDDNDFKNKLGAIFGGKSAAPPPVKEKEKPVVSANMSSKNEDAKNNLAGLFGGKGGGKGMPAPAGRGAGGKGGRGGGGSSSEETSNPLADEGGADNESSVAADGRASPSSPTSPTSPSKPLSKAQQMKKDLEAKEKAAGGAGRGLVPLNRPMSETRIVVGNRNLGGIIKLTQDDERLEKYTKMIKMHLPKEAVKQKMEADGIDPSILDMINDEGVFDESLKPAGRGRGRLSSSGDAGVGVGGGVGVPGGADGGRGRGRGRGRGSSASEGPSSADAEKKEFLRKVSAILSIVSFHFCCKNKKRRRKKSDRSSSFCCCGF